MWGEYLQTLMTRCNGGGTPARGFRPLFMKCTRNADISKRDFGSGGRFTLRAYGLNRLMLILRRVNYYQTKYGGPKLTAFTPTLGENGYG